jgi:hypothetical protein
MKTRLLFSLLLLFAVSTVALAQSYYELTFAVNGRNYYGLLYMNESFQSGTLRVKYYSADCDCYRLVEQAIRTERTTAGTIRLTGYRPHNPRTGAYTNYAADNFYLYGSGATARVFNIDDQGNTARTYSRQLTVRSELIRYLDAFEWL